MGPQVRVIAIERKGDTVARIGGDEFALILPDLKEAGRDRYQLYNKA